MSYKATRNAGMSGHKEYASALRTRADASCPERMKVSERQELPTAQALSNSQTSQQPISPAASASEFAKPAFDCTHMFELIDHD